MDIEFNQDPAVQEKHARSTIAFDGAAGNGAQGTVDVFSITGRVLVTKIIGFCTESLAGATSTIELGDTTDTNGFIAQTTATDLDVNEWWGDTTAGSTLSSMSIFTVSSSGQVVSLTNKAMSVDIIILVGTADCTNGTIVFDVWYTPITDGGSLAAA